MDPEPRKEIEVNPDPDLDPERRLKWIRIRPNAVDPDPKRCLYHRPTFCIIHIAPIDLLQEFICTSRHAPRSLTKRSTYLDKIY